MSIKVSPGLSIIKVKEEKECIEYERIVSEWSVIAKNMKTKLSATLQGANSKDPQKSQKTQQLIRLFDNSDCLCRVMNSFFSDSSCWLKKKDIAKSDKIRAYACIDAKQEPRAFVVLRKQTNAIDIVGLCSHPYSLGYDPDHPAVRGAATLLVKKTLQRAAQKKRRVYAHALIDAGTFYKRLGFAEKTKGSCIFEISANEINKLYPKFRTEPFSHL